MSVTSRYLKVMASVMIAGLVLAMIVNAVIDPYGVVMMVRVSGVNTLKPYASTRVRMFKAYGVMRSHADAIALGNSRVEIGVDPSSIYWPASSRKVYNLGIPGSGLYTAYRYLQHALAVQRPRIVVLGLDFMDFNLGSGASRPDVYAWEKRLLVDANGQKKAGRFNTQVVDLFSSLASLDALSASVRTVWKQSDRLAATLQSDGFNPLREYARYVREQGHYYLFRQRDFENMKFYLTGSWSIHTQSLEPSRAMTSLKAILKLCRDRNISLYLYIHPVHAHLNETIRIAGLWPMFEQWKREVVMLVESENRAHPNEPNARLWDFSGYNPVTTEPVPNRNNRDPMQWYWEAGHYKSSVGDLVLRRILSGTLPPQLRGTEFGAPLSSDNLEQHLNRIRVNGRLYRENMPTPVNQLLRMAERIKAHSVVRVRR